MRSISKMSKKGQLMGIGNAPAIVMIVGLVFLTMATIALIGQKYGDAMLTTTADSAINETGGFLNATGYTLSDSSKLGFSSPTIVRVLNATSGAVIASGNYTLVGNVLYNASADGGNYNTIKVTYTYLNTPPTTAYNATDSLQTEISNNTSIAGIVLTISLIGIVLSILIGVFFGISRRTARV